MMTTMNPSSPTREFSMHKEMFQIFISGHKTAYYFYFPRELPLMSLNFSHMVRRFAADDLGITLTLR